MPKLPYVLGQKKKIRMVARHDDRPKKFLLG